MTLYLFLKQFFEFHDDLIDTKYLAVSKHIFCPDGNGLYMFGFQLPETWPRGYKTFFHFSCS